MILMRANPLLGSLEWVGPSNRFARIKIITSRAVYTTGTLIVNTVYHSPPVKNCAKLKEEEYIKCRICIAIFGGGWSM
jgi:hypothetical protein